MRGRHPLALAVLLLGLATSARAETSKSFQVTATIASGCSVTTASGRWGDIALGTLNGATGGVAEGDLMSGGGIGIGIDCTPGTVVSATADAGLQPQAGTRRLAGPDGGTPIPYQLFANGSTTPWTTQSVSLAFPAGTSHLSLPVRGRATLSGPARAGTYTDTVRITLNW